MNSFGYFLVLGFISYALAQAPPDMPSTGEVAQEPPVTVSSPNDANSVPASGVPTESVPQDSSSAPPREEFNYDPTGRRDPFQPDSPREESRAPEDMPSVVGPDQQTEQPPSRPLEALESYELNQLRVGAIIWNTKNPRAMVIDPGGHAHYVKMKTRLGKRNGFVAAIREGEVVVVEYVQENGQYTKTFKVLELR